MQHFPLTCKFKFPWRDYQDRILNELAHHMEDSHLHLIAPPGSGKTVLGLETARRLNQPVLILAPTLAIRNQWIDRFVELFLSTDEIPEWISTDIRKPGFMTVSTYQGLHAAMKGTKEISAAKASSVLIQNLKQAGIKTLVADEAHHLKLAWWKSLNRIKKELNPTVVGLTATPPYDVSGLEWQRYANFNGPVDAEISVPELVKNGDLAPHQDFVYFSLPTSNEIMQLKKHHVNIQQLFFEISQNEDLKDVLLHHPIWQNPFENLEWIYDNLEKFSSILIFLNFNQEEIPEEYKEIFGQENLEIPALDLSWLEVLLQYFLYSNETYFEQFPNIQEHLEKLLKKYGALEKNRVRIFRNSKNNAYLTRSLSKLNSLYNVFTFEHQQMQDRLRMLILSDYIRAESLDLVNGQPTELNKTGVIPIFEKIRRNYPEHISMVVLTGTLVIVPVDLIPAILAQNAELSLHDFATLPQDSRYAKLLKIQDSGIVSILTKLFQQEQIHVIIGTKSLLGEGWDAPAINTLIMASSVGSFVTSNQMRGRAIRVNPADKNKSANIWHLVSIDPMAADGGLDFDTMRRRFKTFTAPAYEAPHIIENGMERLHIGKELNTPDQIQNQNNYTFSKAADRQKIKEHWENAVSKGSKMIEEIKIPFPENETYFGKKALYWNLTLRNLTGFLAAGMFAVLTESLLQVFYRIWSFGSFKEISIAIIFVLVMTMIYFIIDLVKTANLYLHYRDITKDIEGICETVLYTLTESNFVETPAEKLDLRTEINDYGEIYCYLNGGTRFEQALFIQCLEEILNHVDNPRYLIIRKSSIFYFKKQEDYHHVPEIFGRTKLTAQRFYENWQKYTGDCELIYTRNPAGRKILLQARWQSLSAKLNPRYEPVNVWK